jgi:hypothetical protein
VSGFKFINLVELHVTHDHVSRKATVVIEAEADGERFRYTMEGAYRDQPDAIGASLNVTQKDREADWGPSEWRYRVPDGLPRFVVDFACNMDMTSGKRERLGGGE